jgi:F0F1-type ATP synthase epsilon subunit
VTDRLRFVVRTPHAVALDAEVVSARVPATSGQVGLRPRGEAIAVAIEPGLVLAHGTDDPTFVATAGGLLESDGDHAILYTPFAVASDDAAEVLDALDDAFSTPDSELTARRRLGELEQRIVKEIRQPSSPKRGRIQRD